MKIKNRILLNYILMFFITSLIAICAFIILSIASGIVEDSLVKNKYTALFLMKDDVSDIEYSGVIENNGGIQIVDSNYRIIYTKGINNFPKSQLTVSEFTNFLTESQSVKRKFSYTIAYNERKGFWLIVTFPTSIRLDLAITHNNYYDSSDTAFVVGIFIMGIIIYLIMLMISTLIYSRMTASSFTKPLSKLQESANKLKNGDYSARASLNLKNEFGDLEHSFNEMALQVQREMDLRRKSENLRRQLTLDIAHDLKNPLAAIMGYAEYCLNNPGQNNENYIKIMHQNSCRANSLITGLFDLSKLESPDYKMNTQRADLSEYLRIKAASYIEAIESAGFHYEFSIPEIEIFVNLNIKEMDRAIDNLLENAIRYNDKGTKISMILEEYYTHCEIIFSDSGKGIPSQLTENIFRPFVRADEDRNSETGGSGLGLTITEKIIIMHGGEIALISDIGMGCKFIIKLPKI